MPTERFRRAWLLAAASSLIVAGCGSGDDGDDATTSPSTTSGAPEATAAMLRDAAPEGLDIGAAVAGGGHHDRADYPDPFTNDEPYRAHLAAQFSSLTPENQLKWEFVHPRRDIYEFGPADAIVDFAEANGQAVRGHALLWHSQNPAWLTTGDFTDEELGEILREHIATVVGRYAGRIAQWDVANEIFDDSGALRTAENPWLARFGVSIVADAFRWAHEADPEAVLFLNDYNVESVGPKSDAYHALAQELLADGVPLGGFGVQGHLSMHYPFPDRIEPNLRRFAELGLQVAITELDVRMPLDGAGPTDEQLAEQADQYRRVLDACLAVDTCTSFTIWGASDQYSWVPSFFPDEGAATPWWADLSGKPAYNTLHATLAAATSTRQ